MSKTFRAWSLDQALLLPPSVHDFVPAAALAISSRRPTGWLGSRMIRSM
jgi:hypothetical protein